MTMVSLEIRLDLPEGLAHEAEASGLLTPQAIESLIRAEIRRRIDGLFDAADRLAALKAPPLTDAEVEAGIQAARQQRRTHAGGG